jgi:hypothetical protein
MAVYFQKPQIFSAEDMFNFWMDNLCKEKPHLIIKYRQTSSKPTEIWYEVKEEIEYLNRRNLDLDAKIQSLEVQDRNVNYFTAITEQIFEMKKEIMNNKYKLKELSKVPIDSKEMIMDYSLFKKIIVSFNKKASEEIIAGKTLNLGNKLGFSQIRKIIPPVRSQRIDWAESMQLKKELLAQGVPVKSELHPEGSNWLVFKNQNYYLRWSWVKRSNRDCTVKNNRVYAFYPTASGKGDLPGNRTKLAQANQNDSLLHTRYPVIELLQYIKK